MARILVIEDEPIVRKVIQRMLEKEGHEVIEAFDGEMGIRLYREDPADLVITDIIMPKKEGLETIKELRREFPDVKVVAMSGGGKIESSSYLDLAKRFGAIGTFEKSYGWNDMIDIIRGLFPPESN